MGPGPFHPAISHPERVARLRGLRAITELYCGKMHPLVKALWLAETMAASALVVHGGVAVPAGSRVSVERV